IGSRFLHVIYGSLIFSSVFSFSLLAVVAKLTSLFIGLLGMFFSAKSFQSTASVVVGSSKLRIELDGLVIISYRFLVLLEIRVSLASAVVGSSILRIELDGSIKVSYRLVVLSPVSVMTAS